MLSLMLASLGIAFLASTLLDAGATDENDFEKDSAGNETEQALLADHADLIDVVNLADNEGSDASAAVRPTTDADKVAMNDSETAPFDQSDEAQVDASLDQQAAPSEIDALAAVDDQTSNEDISALEEDQGGIFHLTVEIGSASTKQSIEIAALPAPLDDWSLDGNLPTIDVTKHSVEKLELDFDKESGCLYVVQADYIQSAMINNEPGIEAFCGMNVYFFPEGSSFPDDYVWSQEGATPYQSKSFQDDPSDFAEARLILRIDTGSFGYQLEGDGSILYDTRTGNPAILSNLPIVWR